MSDQMKNAFIGIFVVAALGIIIGIILFMEPTVGDGGKTVHVRFSNISGVNIGTRVNLAGRAVGEVESIEEVENARKMEKEEMGRVYFYQLALKVDSKVHIYNTDLISIRTTGLLGEKTIEIIPKLPEKDVQPKEITDKIIYGESIDPFEIAFHQISSLSEKIHQAVNHLSVWFVNNQNELSFAVKSFGSAMNEIDQTLTAVNQEMLPQSLKEAMNLFSSNMQIIQESLTEMKDNETVTKFNTIVDNFAQASQSINKEGKKILKNFNMISQDLADGTGTIGKLIKTDDAYLTWMGIMNKIDTLMNDINHYGLLFQYDKKWQRIRTKRANLLNALDTPKEFKQYFEKEMDSITTSLCRVSVLLKKAENKREKERIMKSISFKRDFKCLLQKVENLMDTLQLYNQQLMETKN